MISRLQADLFRESVIAQHDDEDYDESGYVAVKIGDWCALTRYGHCSCYDTWADITGGGISDDVGPDEPRWDWRGTYADLLKMARDKADPALPGRLSDPKDYDHDHLLNVYSQILAREDAK